MANRTRVAKAGHSAPLLPAVLQRTGEGPRLKARCWTPTMKLYVGIEPHSNNNAAALLDEVVRVVDLKRQGNVGIPQRSYGIIPTS
jgi:hypothetical protein